MTTTDTYFAIEYLGYALETADTLGEAQATKANLVRQIWEGRLPDFLTRDDFDSIADCYEQIAIVERTVGDW